MPRKPYVPPPPREKRSRASKDAAPKYSSDGMPADEPPKKKGRAWGNAAKNCTSAFRGVTGKPGKWEAHIKMPNKKTEYLGTFETEVDAARAFDAKCRAVRENPRLNFPGDNAPAPKRVEHAPTSSKYRGVTKRPGGKYKAQIGHAGIGNFGQQFLGNFEDEISAARAYDARARELGKHAWCNFPQDEGPPPQRNLPSKSSQYRGVRTHGGKWLAQIKHTQKYNGGRTEYLGVFEDEREAAEAYDAACRAIGRHASVNFPLEHDATGEVHAAKALLGLLA